MSQACTRKGGVKVVTMPSLSSPVAPQVVIITSCGAPTDNKVDGFLAAEIIKYHQFASDAHWINSFVQPRPQAVDPYILPTHIHYNDQ